MNVTQYLFEKSASLDKNFVRGNKETISYKDLYHQASQMASYLTQKYGTDKNILLVSENNSFFLICYLGIMLSGNVCIPLDTAIEQRNFEHIYKETNPVSCFIEKRILNKLSLPEIDIITNLDYNSFIDGQANFEVSGLFNAELPAQIIFTSGSTGSPKGVVLSHKNIIANTNSIIQYLKLNKTDIMEVVLPFHYCYGLSLLHTHLRVGGSVVLNNSFMFIKKVLDDINEYKCTGFAGVPSHFQILLRKSKSLKTTTFPSLKYVTQAGGKLHNSFIEEFTNILPNVKFFVMYGQTEATARLSYLEPEKLKDKLGSIGKGIPDVDLKVINKDGNIVQPGGVGEIVAKGDNIMLGYYKDKESTRKVLKDKWLYTGDVGTIDEDGFIYLTARKKEIIKISGKRVSPKEIEEVLVSFPEVVDCTIETVYDEVTGEGIKAIVVLNDDAPQNITVDVLKMYCGSKLASYKVPKYIEFAKNVNVSSTGKKVKK